MKLQSLTIIFIIIILPVTVVLSAYIGYELKTIDKQNLYNSGVISATHDAIFSFEINTKNDDYATKPEIKRDILKASVKTFENSLSTTCNLGLYGNDKIEEYIPAILYGMYDGFYMYSPYETQEGYKHDLRNYVYYSETLPGTDIVIRYSLDNYVSVSGTFGDDYITNSGYLINLDKISSLTNAHCVYDDILITVNDERESYYYYQQAFQFTEWFLDVDAIVERDYLNINSTNDPEDENSAFVQHKRKIMKDKIQNTLNSSITAYKLKTGNDYKMPVLTEEEWNKIYSNISVVSFVQGMNLGFKTYNSYCVLNSTNNNEYVNPNLIYYIYNGEYHDIRCSELLKATSYNQIEGFKIGDFEKITNETTDDEGNTKRNYKYKHNETACYNCINGISKNMTPIKEYIESAPKIKAAYYIAVAKERYNTIKLSDKTDTIV